MPRTSQARTTRIAAAGSLVELLMPSLSTNSTPLPATPDLMSFTTQLGLLGHKLIAQRYLVDRTGPPKGRRAENILHLLHNSRTEDRQTFRRLVRMWPEAFDQILSKIKNHAVFAGRDCRSAEYQLAVFLYRMGRNGNGASLRDIAQHLGLSTGSVVNYTKNVTSALFDLRHKALAWASEDDKIKSKAWVQSRAGVKEWQHGFAMVDGTLVPLEFAPGLEGHFDRKKNYSLNVQLVVLPHNLRVIDYVVGLPGSTHDSSAFSRSDIFKNPRRYLAPGEWIWADLGYSLSEHIVSPYSHTASLASAEFRQFNTAVSNIRIRSEHAIGYLKGRFQALKGLRNMIQDVDSQSQASRLIIALLVAHNLAIPFDDVDEYTFYIDQADNDNIAMDQVTEAMQQRWEEANTLYLEEQQFQQQHLPRYRRDQERRKQARLLREALHKALFRARGKRFIDTSEASRLLEKTKDRLLRH